MPLIQIRRGEKITNSAVIALIGNLPWVASELLCCSEGGALGPTDIMIEVDDMGPLDKNTKDIHIRVWAHDYAERRQRLDFIRRYIGEEVVKHIPKGASWYVWVLLAPTSYGSDTEEK